MLRLALVLYAMIGTSLAGIFMVAALTMGMDTAQPIIWAAIAGFAVGLPVSWVIAKQINA
ncbi:CTP synthetase [Aliiroseovarius marinus]|uniref:CTP synthetase n=1 Tax=Aliiroseovarius marinus TaxID=2500159 RepID=UPI003D7E9D49